MNETKFDPHKRENIIAFRSKQACEKLNLYYIWNFIVKYKVIFASIMIILGLFELLFGNYLIRPTTYIICMAAVVIFTFVLIFQIFIPSGTHEAVVWVVLVISLVLGGVAGYFVSKYNKIFLSIILGAVSGFFIAQVLYTTIFAKIKSKPVLVKVLTYVICIGVLIAIACFLINFIVIFATSFIGAYVFIRGISIFAGGFPNEGTIIDLIEKKEFASLKNLLTWKVYIYFAAIIICFVIGMVVQFKLKARMEKEKEEKDREQFLGPTFD